MYIYIYIYIYTHTHTHVDECPMGKQVGVNNQHKFYFMVLF